MSKQKMKIVLLVVMMLFATFAYLRIQDAPNPVMYLILGYGLALLVTHGMSAILDGLDGIYQERMRAE